MTYIEYLLAHEEERRDADGCEGCTYQDREPWETPCLICKRNTMDLFERRADEVDDRLLDDK